MKQFAIESQVINPILNIIKKNQVYLTQPENLPQLAKLGYMYNTLWYAGRMCWGGGKDALIKTVGKYGQCGDNPKYKIEMCEPQTKEIDNFIYDAWGMHIGDDMQPFWEEFSTIVLKGKEFTDFDKKQRKPLKTFDEWAEVLTDERYRYNSIYPDRRSVANHLLCVNGNGYGYKDGYIIYEASGADQDIDLYGYWENAVFRKDIKKTVERLMAIPEVQQTIDTAADYINDYNKKKKEKEDAEWIKITGMTYKEYIKSEKYKEINKILGTEEEKYHPYYPISEYPYSNISAFDENTHPSYIKAGIEICKDILAHEKEEMDCKYGNKGQNVKFAKKYLIKFDGK